MYQTGSALDKCSLYSDRNLINRRNVRSDVSDAVNACRSFFQLAVESRVVAACLHVLNMVDLDGTPNNHKFCGDMASKDDKKAYIEEVATLVVDRFVFKQVPYINTNIRHMHICNYHRGRFSGGASGAPQKNFLVPPRKLENILHLG